MSRRALLCLATLLNLLLVCAPLLAPGGQSHAALTSPLVWTFVGLIALFCLCEGGAVNLTEAARPESARAAVLPYLTGLVLLGIFWLCLIEVAGGSRAPVVIAAAGALFFCAGVVLRVVAIRALGRYFVSHVALRQRHRLVCRGIYSVLRHPSELGLLLVGFGAPLLTHSAAGLALAGIALLPLSLVRIRTEDRIMLSRFGSQFLRYKSTTPALFPKLG